MLIQDYRDSVHGRAHNWLTEAPAGQPVQLQFSTVARAHRTYLYSGIFEEDRLYGP